MADKKMGAPTKYQPAFNEEARLFCLLKGATDAQLAVHLGVAESTIKEWYKKYPDFSASVKAGKTGADMRVAEGFFKRATGYNYNEVTFEKVDGQSLLLALPDSELMEDSYKKKIVTKHLPPDAGAALNWLKNRQPDDWRDKIEHQHSGRIDHSDLSTLSDEQLNRLQDELLAKINNATANP
ncbi:helix-turn-helix domain-containing protein [Spirosoma sp. RP8]|uniref:Helix-turn-helix domain-containing protein n=1 Tax=Spirosoma liriopis TaxID=2937440 RepID=A0ABT0HV26_9BACT|nr:helix-turn-helix domain-containing protein [Spirosoma liriopis]MCK8496046.1 helix-turn-helix domain-containing protein [Spirosoma liriopis]